MRLHIIRHADPDYELDTITRRGQAEADVLAARLKSMSVNELYSSPLGRARATAAAAARLLDLPVGILEWTRELSKFDLTTRRAMAIDAHGHEVRNPAYLADPWDLSLIDGMPVDRILEVKATLAAESDSFLAAHGYEREGQVYRVAARSDQQIAVICHAGLGLTWLAHLLAIPCPLVWAGFYLHPTSVTTVLFDEREEDIATPRCLMVGDISHLYAAGLQPSTRGLVANAT